MLFTVKNEDDTISFSDEYIEYVKDNFDENKNFSKMIMVFDNTENILNSKININESDELGNENDRFLTIFYSLSISFYSF
jgi:hypothetical protein